MLSANPVSDTECVGRATRGRRPILDPAATVIATSPDRVVVWCLGHTMGLRAGENRAAAMASFLTDLTGAQPLEQVARVHGVDSALAERVVDALHDDDLVRFTPDTGDEGGDDARASSRPRPRSDLDAWDLPHRLADVTVALLGWDPVLEAIARQLRDLGVGRLAVLADEAPRNRPVGWRGALDFQAAGDRPPPGSALAITSWDETARAVADSEVRCRQGDVPLLPCGWSATLAIVGPLLNATSAVCFDCFWQRRRSHMAPSPDRDAFVQAWRAGTVRPLKQPVLSPHIELVAAMATLEAIRVVRGLDTPTARGGALCFDVELMVLTHEHVLPLPQCRRCRSGATQTGALA